jgi:hypothetical protein
MFIIYAKPSVGAAGGPLGPEDADFYLPLATAADGIRNPVNFNFDKEMTDHHFTVAVAA